MGPERKSFAVYLGNKLKGMGFEVQEVPAEGKLFAKRTRVEMTFSDTFLAVGIIPNDEGWMVVYLEFTLLVHEWYQGKFNKKGEPISGGGKVILEKLNLPEVPPQS